MDTIILKNDGFLTINSILKKTPIHSLIFELLTGLSKMYVGANI